MSGKPCTCPGGHDSHYMGCLYRMKLPCGCTGGLCDHECHRGAPCSHCAAQHAAPDTETKV